MSVLENLLLGAGPRPNRARLADAFERVYALFPRLKERERQLAHSMSGGEQQSARSPAALSAEPKDADGGRVLIGLSPQLREEVATALRRLNEEGVAILPDRAKRARGARLSHRAYVLRAGRIVLSGSAGDLLAGGELETVFLRETG